jgi:hypothetical protein
MAANNAMATGWKGVIGKAAATRVGTQANISHEIPKMLPCDINDIRVTQTVRAVYHEEAFPGTLCKGGDRM